MRMEMDMHLEMNHRPTQQQLMNSHAKGHHQEHQQLI